MLNILIRIANALDAALIQPITNTIDAIAAGVYYFLAASYLVGSWLVQFAGFVFRLLCEGYQLITVARRECKVFFIELQHVAKDVFDYVYYGTGDGLKLGSRLLKGILLLLSNIVIELGKLTLWILMLLPRAIIVILDYMIVAIEHMARFAWEIATHLFHHLLCLSIGIAVLLVLYMYRGYVYLYIRMLLRKLRHLLQYKLKKAVQGIWAYADRQTYWLLRKFEIGERKSLNRPDQCVICMERRKNIVLLPCRHLCLCKECSQQLTRFEGGNRCPICRDFIDAVITVYS